MSVIVGLAIVFVLMFLFSGGDSTENPDEVVIADSVEEAFQKCSYRYGSPYGTAYVIAETRVERSLSDPKRWSVFYSVRKPNQSPVTDIPMQWANDGSEET